MKEIQDILNISLHQPALQDQLQLASTEQGGVADCMDYKVYRYVYEQALPVEDVAMVVFQPAQKGTAAHIELLYCVAGNKYCKNPKCSNEVCADPKKDACKEWKTTVDLVSIQFKPSFIKALQQEQSSSKIFDLSGRKAFVKTLTPCTRSKRVLEQMVHHTYEGTLKNIFLHSKGLELLLFSSDQFIQNDTEERYGCRFLTQADDRSKIEKARAILLEQLDSPVTIRELARRVAMNECYLKKGFKAMYGTTIYDYFQKERMEKAKGLLYEKGLSVSDVAMMMGYSCISHFSTAFKKHTGLKPCELLFR
jgi:AraC-like DNA-binding protein